MKSSWQFKLGCLNMAAGIAVAAAGGHKPWPTEQKEIFNKAVLYHFINGIGIIVSSMSITSIIPTIFFQAGVFLFCIPLYHRAFTGEKTLSGFWPPFGGISMMLAWIIMAFMK